MMRPSDNPSLEEYLRNMVRTAREAREEALSCGQPAGFEPITPILVLQTPVHGIPACLESALPLSAALPPPA